MKIFPALAAVVCLALFFSISAAAQDEAFRDGSEIERKVERMLETRDVGRLADELAAGRSASVDDVLVRLSVFARAGHRARLHAALREAGGFYESSPEEKIRMTRVARRAVSDDDLAAMRIFYEHLAPHGDDRTGAFVARWTAQGDARELEKWLAARADASETWWYYWIDLKKSLGTIDEVAAALEQRIRANPADLELINKYLRVVSTEIHSSIGLKSSNFQQRDVSWLAETEAARTAYGAYEVANFVRSSDPALAVELYRRSLGLPFTERDGQLMAARTLTASSWPGTSVSPEKLFRYRAKQALAELYRETGRPELAQPLVEELTSPEMREIASSGDFALAGGVQSASGQRAVESKILADEAAGENSPQYWIDRASYYKGRDEAELVWQTYVRALEKFPYAAADAKANASRLSILLGFENFGRRKREKETGEFFRREFARARAERDHAYLYELARIVEDFKSLRDELFVNTALLTEIFSGFTIWPADAEHLLEDVMESERWNPARREAVWNRLVELARRNVRRNAYALALALAETKEYRKAVPLFEACLKYAPVEYVADLSYNRESVERELFDAYLAAGDWPKAEKMRAAGYRYWPADANKIALAAARSGKTADAVRLWKALANTDRRNLALLAELATTAAAAPLREFYLEMKKRDSLTDAPDKALALLR